MTRSTRGWWILALAVASCVTHAGPMAHADDALDARFFDARGRQLYALSEFDAALRAFLRADAIAPSATTAYNVGLTAELASEPLLAWNAYERFLRTAPDEHRLRADATRRQHGLDGRVQVIEVASSPEGAEVFVDRVDHGVLGRTPLRVALPAGAHTVLLRAERHELFEYPVDGAAGDTVRLSAELHPRRGTLDVRGIPSGGTLWLQRDDGIVTEVTSDGRVELLIGTYRLVLHARDVRHPEVQVELNEGETQTLRLTPVPIHGPSGRLAVRVSPDATLLVDGVEIARAPVVLPEVRVGWRVVELRAPGHRTYTTRVDVREGQAVRLDVSLVPDRRPASR